MTFGIEMGVHGRINKEKVNRNKKMFRIENIKNIEWQGLWKVEGLDLNHNHEGRRENHVIHE